MGNVFDHYIIRLISPLDHQVTIKEIQLEIMIDTITLHTAALALRFGTKEL